MDPHALGLNVTIPTFPGGAALPIGFFFLCHIAVAEYSAGAVTLAPAVEMWGARHNNDPRHLRYAHSLANSYYLVFSLGATLAVFAVVLLIGLRGREMGDLINALLPMMALAFGLFLILAPLLVWYRNSFQKMAPQRHVLLGFSVTFWQLLFVVCIVTLDSYLMTPLHGGFLEATTNPPYVPLLVHRLIGNVSWTALFLAAFAALKLRRRDDEDERRFQSWALRLNLRIGLITAVAMPFDGFILLEVLKSTQFGYFDNLVASQRPWLFIIQEALLAVVFIGGNIALILEPGGNRRLNKVGWLAVAVSVVGMVLACMPAAVLSGGTMWLRYAGIAGASGMTLLHAVLRCLPQRTTLASRPMGVLSGAGSRVIAAVGLASVVVALFMGYIKEQGRGDYSIYGELRDKDAAGHFQPPPGTYP